MANGYPPFIFQDAVPAQQMMAHAQAINEGQRIQELGKARQAEGLFRMADLQLRRKQAEEQNQLNRLIAESQIAQNASALDLQGKMASERNKNYLEGLRIQFPQGRLSPEALKQQYDEQLRNQQEQQETSLAAQLGDELKRLDTEITRVTPLEKAPKKLSGYGSLTGALAKASMGIPGIVWSLASLDNQQAVRDQLRQALQRDPTDKEINDFIKDAKTYRASPEGSRLAALNQRKTTLLNQLAQYGWTYSPTTGQIIRPSVGRIPTASQMNQPPAPPDIDEIKRQAAAAIQAGKDPAAVYQRAAELGVDLR